VYGWKPDPIYAVNKAVSGTGQSEKHLISSRRMLPSSGTSGITRRNVQGIVLGNN